MPSAVNRNKVFFELEGTGEAVDLEGDVGVVGRLLSDVSEKHGSGLQMDMKGVIYNARILPTSSVVILAVNANEAKVESITHDFVQLRRDPVANGGVGSDARWVPGRRQRRRGGRAQGRGGPRGGGGCEGDGRRERRRGHGAGASARARVAGAGRGRARSWARTGRGRRRGDAAGEGGEGAGQGEEEARQATQEVAASVTLTLVSHRMELRLF